MFVCFTICFFVKKNYLLWTITLFLQQKKLNIECFIVFKNLSFTKVVCVAFCFWHSLFFLGHFGHHAFLVNQWIWILLTGTKHTFHTSLKYIFGRVCQIMTLQNTFFWPNLSYARIIFPAGFAGHRILNNDLIV
jgi:hypothetical protein